MRKISFLLIILSLSISATSFAGQTSITSSGYYCSSDSFSSGNNNYTCSAGTIFPSGSGELCTYDQTPCVQQTSTPSCPSGYSWNGTSCVSTVSASCPSGYTYDSSTGECTETTTSTTSPTCPYGSFSNGQCIYSKSWTTGSGWGSYCGYDEFCITPPACPGSYISGSCSGEDGYPPGNYRQNLSYSGSHEIVEEKCYDHGNGPNIYSMSCYYYPTCPSGYTYSNGTCTTTTTITASSTCPSGYTLSGNTCTATTSATCPSGTTLINNECVSYSCPLGGSTQCIEPSGSSTYYCSPETCQYLTYNNGTITISGSASTSGSLPQAPPNNGTVTSAGCQGSIYIFSGTAVSCRSGGLQTAYHDCCNAGTYLFGAVQCNSTEKVTAQSLTYDQQYGNSVYPNANYTGGLEGEDIYVGSYCSDSFLGMCLETMDVFCQFPGLLAATIQQQGRAQLGTGWGSAQNPDCSGFTPNQFQELNFGNMNLSNYTNVLEQTTINGLSGTVNSNIGNIENSITNEINQSMSGQ